MRVYTILTEFYPCRQLQKFCKGIECRKRGIHVCPHICRHRPSNRPTDLITRDIELCATIQVVLVPRFLPERPSNKQLFPDFGIRPLDML